MNDHPRLFAPPHPAYPSRREFLTRAGVGFGAVGLAALLQQTGLGDWTLRLEHDGHVLCYEFDSHAERTGIASLMRRLSDLGIAYKDLSTHQSSLEDIFVELVHQPKEPA